MFGSTVRAHPKADLESGAKPKVVNVVDVTKLVRVVSAGATPMQFVSAGGIPAGIRDDSATADNATDLDEGSAFRSSTDSLPQLPPSGAELREAKQE